MGMLDLFQQILPLAHAAKQSVSPVGRSCENMLISNGNGKQYGGGRAHGGRDTRKRKSGGQ